MKEIAVRVKGILALVTAVVADIAIYFEDDTVSNHEWFLITMITLGAIGTYVFPNTMNGENVISLARKARIIELTRWDRER
jgi:hypothetical protein